MEIGVKLESFLKQEELLAKSYDQTYEDYLKEESVIYNSLIRSATEHEIALPEGIDLETAIEDFNNRLFLENSETNSPELSQDLLPFHIVINSCSTNKDSSDNQYSKTVPETVASLLDLKISELEMKKWLLVIHDLTGNEKVLEWYNSQIELSSIPEINESLIDLKNQQNNALIRSTIKNNIIQSLSFLFGEHDNVQALTNAIVMHCVFDILANPDDQKTDRKEKFKQDILALSKNYIDPSLLPTIIYKTLLELKYWGYTA